MNTGNRPNDLADRLLLPNLKSSETPEDREVIDVYPNMFQLSAPDNSILNVGTWICKPQVRNRLVWSENNPLTAREVHFQYGEIHWTAGGGWPTYFVPMPLNYTSDKNHWKGFPRHCVVWEVGGQPWYTGNNSGGFRGNRLMEVFVSVNDDIYSDNDGVITVIITAYSQN